VGVTEKSHDLRILIISLEPFAPPIKGQKGEPDMLAYFWLALTSFHGEII
jgi:hypothetical protein